MHLHCRSAAHGLAAAGVGSVTEVVIYTYDAGVVQSGAADAHYGAGAGAGKVVSNAAVVVQHHVRRSGTAAGTGTGAGAGAGAGAETVTGSGVVKESGVLCPLYPLTYAYTTENKQHRTHNRDMNNSDDIVT